MNRSDEYLLELALQGDAACFGQIVERWQKRIHGFICRYVGSGDDAQDLTQDTFTKAFTNLHRLADPARFSSWLYTIALNECRMRFRRERRLQWTSLDSAPEEGPASELRSREESPETLLAQREEARQLREVFQALPEEQRLVIVMKEYQELKFQEIAEILGVPVSTVKSRMYLGLKTLRRLMEKRS